MRDPTLIIDIDRAHDPEVADRDVRHRDLRSPGSFVERCRRSDHHVAPGWAPASTCISPIR